MEAYFNDKPISKFVYIEFDDGFWKSLTINQYYIFRLKEIACYAQKPFIEGYPTGLALYFNTEYRKILFSKRLFPY